MPENDNGRAPMPEATPAPLSSGDQDTSLPDAARWFVRLVTDEVGPDVVAAWSEYLSGEVRS